MCSLLIYPFTHTSDLANDKHFCGLQSSIGFESFIPVETTADGNCFYNAISIILISFEQYHCLLRILVIFTLFEYEQHFRNLLKNTFGEESFNQFIISVSKNGNWANEYVIFAMSIVLDATINIYTLDDKSR